MVMLDRPRHVGYRSQSGLWRVWPKGGTHHEGKRAAYWVGSGSASASALAICDPWGSPGGGERHRPAPAQHWPGSEQLAHVLPHLQWLALQSAQPSKPANGPETRAQMD